MKKAVIAFSALSLAALSLAACGGAETESPTSSATTPDQPAPEQAAAPSPSEMLDAAIAGEHRSEEEKARDGWRHPKQTLEFFGVEPSMKVVEIWPGGGWYANVIAPYLKAGDGVYFGAGFDPARSERSAAAVAAFTEKFAGDAETYGTVNVTVLGDNGEIAPAGSADAVLTFRNVHNWMGGESRAEAFFAQFYTALKPGGILGVVEHRADGAEGEGNTGYVTEATVIALAEAAGFVFEERSEINANPADTKDHPFGVWTLPPVRRSSAAGEAPAADFDRAKYDAIGESDRMTLRFRKPADSQ